MRKPITSLATPCGAARIAAEKNQEGQNRIETMNTPAPNPFVLPDLGQVDPRVLVPVVPIRWVDYDVAQRPFASPDDEFIRSPYPVNAEILRERWAGLYDERDLKVWSESNALKTKRFEYQDKLAQESLSRSYAGDVEYIARRIDREIVDLSHLIERVNADIAAGFEYRPIKGASAGPLSYTRMPLTADSLRKLIAARVELSNRLSELLGLATKIVKVSVSVENPLHVDLQKFLEANDPEYAALQRLIEGDLLPRGALAAGDGQTMDATARAKFERGRVVEGAQLPRLNDV